MNEEEKKAIERIEDTFYSDLGKGVNKFQKITLYEDSIKDVRVVLNLLEKLQKENSDLKYGLSWRIGYCQDLEKDLFENCSNYVIPIQTIKDKIEELKQEKEKYGNCLIEMYEDELANRDIKILQELLEGRK